MQYATGSCNLIQGPDVKMFEEVRRFWLPKKECMRRSDPGNVKETHNDVTLACDDDY